MCVYIYVLIDLNAVILPVSLLESLYVVHSALKYPI